MYTGMALTGLGSAALVGGVTVAVWAENGAGCSGEECGMSGVYTAFLAVPMIASSVVLAGVGVPLWVLGARAPANTTTQTSGPPLAPAVSIGPRAVALRWQL